MSPQKLKLKKDNPDENIPDEVTQELKQIAKENAALKKLLESVAAGQPGSYRQPEKPVENK